MLAQSTLDVRQLPFEATYTCDDGKTIDMVEFLDRFRGIVEVAAEESFIDDTESFGIAVTKPMTIEEFYADAHMDGLCYDWGHPEKFVWFAGGWGPDRDRYVVNVAGKITPMLRRRAKSTLDLRFEVLAGDGNIWRNVIKPTLQPDGSYSIGDFPWAGAVVVSMGGMIVVCGVSCLHELDDHSTAQFFGSLLLGDILRHNNPGGIFTYND